MSRVLITVIPELDNAQIRRTSEGRFSVYDLISISGTKKDACVVWKTLVDRYPEVLERVNNFQFPGRGQKPTPVTDREGWLHILGLLPGVMGRKYRESAANLVVRYLDSDITLAESIVERTTDEEGLERLAVRIKSKKIRKEHTSILKARGVTSKEYAICTNKTYQGLYGTTAKGLRQRKNLPPKSNVREHMTTDELIEVSFSENVSTRKIKQSNAMGYEECGSINYETAKGVADFIRDTLAS